MEKTKMFDVLIVYSNLIAASASSDDSSIIRPFFGHRENYNDSYQYFLETCKQMNLNGALTTSEDFRDGKFTCYWIFANNKWHKINKPCESKLIFDKFSPRTSLNRKNRTSLFADSSIKPFTSPELLELFFDKQKTYKQLKDFTMPTVPIFSEKSIPAQIDNLNALISVHPGKKDFSTHFIMKDRYGSGGNGIFKIKSKNHIQEIQTVLSENKDTKFIVQPFVKFKKGYSYKKYSGYIDLRIVYLDGKAIQTYIRVASKKNFRCNEHQGGRLEYISLRELPDNILELSNHISQVLNKKDSLYALDFIVSDRGNVYMLEGNTGPGLDWNLSLKKNERKSKELIRLVISNIYRKIGEEKNLRNYLVPQMHEQLQIPSPQIFN
jgi:hypothetical protein